MNEVVKYEPTMPAKSSGTLKGILNSDSFRQSLGEIVAKHVTPERIVKMVLLAASRQPKLLECTQESILKAAMTSAELGLDCSGTLGRAYLVPFKNNKIGGTEVQFMAGYLGLMDLARRSGEIESMTAEVVYESDEFIYEKGLEEKLVHRPNRKGKRTDKDIIAAYFIARFRPSGHHIEVMWIEDIEKIRSRSRASTSGPWVTDYAAMCKKTVVRAGLKWCPLSIETQQAIAKTDDEFADSLAESVRQSPERGTLNIEDLKPGNPEDHVDVAATPEKDEKKQSIIPDDEAAEYRLEEIASSVLPDDLVADNSRWLVCRTLILKALKVKSPTEVTEEAWAMLPTFLKSAAFQKELVAENLIPRKRG